MSQTTNSATNVVVSSKQKQDALDAATLPTTISDQEILGGGALSQDSFGDANEFLAQKEQAVTLKDAEPKIEVVKKATPVESIDDAFNIPKETQEAIVEQVAQNTLDQANAAVAAQAGQPTEQAIHFQVGSDTTADPVNAEQLVNEVDSFISSPEAATKDAWVDDSDKCSEPASPIQGDAIAVAFNPPHSIATYILSLAAVGLTVTHVDGGTGLNSLIAFPVNEYLGTDKPHNHLDGSLKLPRVSFKAELPDIEDESQVKSILTLLDESKRVLSYDDIKPYIYVSQEYSEISGEKFESLVDAYNNGDLVLLNTLTEDQIAECSQHELLIVLLPGQSTATANTINLRYIGDPTSFLHYTKNDTAEVFAPSLSVFGSWLAYLSNNGLGIHGVFFTTSHTEENGVIVWKENLMFNAVGDDTLINDLINPVFGGDKLLNNLDRDSELEIGRYEYCSLSSDFNGSRGVLGSEYRVTVTAKHTDASKYESVSD